MLVKIAWNLLDLGLTTAAVVLDLAATRTNQIIEKDDSLTAKTARRLLQDGDLVSGLIAPKSLQEFGRCAAASVVIAGEFCAHGLPYGLAEMAGNTPELIGKFIHGTFASRMASDMDEADAATS